MPSSSRERSCRSSGLPPALAGLRIGLITDVHRSQWVSHEDVHARRSPADVGDSPI